jgi:hypothetical protein
MTHRTHDFPLVYWADNMEELDAEIARLAIVCGIRILEPGAIGRVLQSDAAICGAENDIAFVKLRNLLKVHLALREKSVDEFGPAQTAQLERIVIDRLARRFPHLLGDNPGAKPSF